MSHIEKLYHINNYGQVLITPHIAVWEYRDRIDGTMPYIENTEHLNAILTLFIIFENIRNKWDKPIKILSGFRTHSHQMQLVKENKKAALYSPHEKGVALDITAGTVEDNEQLYKIICDSYQWLRVGFYKYQKKFIHIDTAPILPDNSIPNSKVEINGQIFTVSELWHKEGLRW